MDLNMVRLIFTLKLESDCTDRHVFFGMRSRFIASFSRVAGCGGPESGQCTNEDICPFHQNFSQPLSPDEAAVKRHQKPGLPFVFDMPVLPPAPNRGSILELGLVIVGSAVHYATEYIAATEEMLQGSAMGSGMTALLLSVESVGYDGSRTMIKRERGNAEPGRILTLSLRGLQQGAVLSADTVSVVIETPMQLMEMGRPAREFTFSLFVRSLFRRVSSLAYHYGGEEAEMDFKWLTERSRHIVPVTTDIRWVAGESRWSGFLGKGTFSGDLSEYHSFLLAGEYLHAGKGASFGLGRFSLNCVAVPL